MFRIKRLKDGLYYKGPLYKNVFTKTGKRYKTLAQAEALLRDIAEYRTLEAQSNGSLVIEQEK